MDAQREFEIKCELRSGAPVKPEPTGYIDPNQFSDDREGEIAGRDEYVGKTMPLDEARHEAFRLARFTMKAVTVDVKIKGQDDDIEIVRPTARVA